MMSWLEALDPVLAIYGSCIVGLLAIAGLVLLVMDRVLGRDVSGVWRTYRGWLIMVPFLAIALLLGRVGVIVGVGLLSCGAFKEFARATGLYKDWWYTGGVYVGIAALVVVTLVPNPRPGSPEGPAALGWYGIFMALPVYVIALLLAVPIWRNRSKGQLQLVSLSTLGFIYLGWMFCHLGFLANAPNYYGNLLFLLFAVELNDIAAFVCGKAFGRRELRSEISPNKTLEGSLGALAVAMVLPWLMRFSFPHFGVAELLLTGLIVGVGGQLGDLTISFIKRDLGIKDMGAVIPGHGGLLDRVDSLVFVAPLFFHMTRWFHGT